MKKIISAVLIITICLSLTANVLANGEFENAKTLLNELGIIEDLDYNADGITRAEMTRIMARMRGDIQLRFFFRNWTDRFVDVNKEHWAYEYIEICRNFGFSVISGDGYGNFRPNDFTTYVETIAMLVRLLGWGWVANSLDFGGFPYGYIRIAQEHLNIDVDIENIHTNISFQAIITIIYQAMHAPTAEYVRGLAVTYNRFPSLIERRNME